ncbi:TIGR01212 family radical SAM protein [Malonomonas rubra]|uniref:TIGR01212 family radical SAM protein n=1 Tax=Malonomonas rubra TaxID=57040 RepID=UPI0026ECC0A5|nr:TIGR01212 family radical SAM protein [Malonomonas rubra]
MRKKAFRLYSTYLKQCFGGRVHKISIDAGFGCPNRDGGRDAHGCLFCDPGGSGAVGIERNEPIPVQIERAKELMRRKYRAKYFIAYFQPFSNTFAPVEVLRDCYDQALAVDDVVGLAVGTRPDCLPTEVLDLLAEYHQQTYFWLEIGLQTVHDKTLNFLQRGHDYQCFLDAHQQAKERGIKVCVHLILGLPGETREDILATAEEMARLQVDGVKLHLLHVLEGTPLGDLYKQGQVSMFEMEDYVELVVDVIERLPPDTLIQRLTGDGPRHILLAPLWSMNKWEVLNAIDDELEKRGTRQGDKFRG